MSLKSVAAQRAFDAAERGLVADPIARVGIRLLIRGRLRALAREEALDEATLRHGPIAPAPSEANDQHYEVPAEFFGLVLGSWRKYSSGLWLEGETTLDGAEIAMLRLTCERADLADEQDVLDLGCGWGALALYAAERYSKSRFVAVSHSHSQRRFIEGEAARRGLTNVRVLTRGIDELELEPASFDRIVSVEMFEHMSNYERLMGRIAEWLRSDGRLFVHVFCHRERAYRFSTQGAGDWMAREFFTGGLMPSASLLTRFGGSLEPRAKWFISGDHYAKTAEAWLERLDTRRAEVAAVFASGYGEDAAERHIERWRLFFLAVAETFGYRRGREWGIAHHVFRKRSSAAPRPDEKSAR